ncbi:MAG: sel1 repeat family protein [Deltaproteobacteria bacterium]|nr:sel1 repeat family protein [Deltaproteobacteria bacterium]
MKNIFYILLFLNVILTSCGKSSTEDSSKKTSDRAVEKENSRKGEELYIRASELLKTGHTPENLRQSNRMLIKSCSFGNGEACLMLGVHYNFGKGFTLDKSKALEAWMTGCTEGKSHKCCGLIANSYLEGKGYKKDRKKALEYYKKACEYSKTYDCKAKSKNPRQQKGCELMKNSSCNWVVQLSKKTSR